MELRRQSRYLVLMRAVRAKESKEEVAILPVAAFDASLRGLGVPQS